MLGPMANLSANQENLRHFFPCYDRYKPIGNRRKPISLDEVHDDENPHSDGQGYAYVENPIIMDFFDRKSRVFRSSPLSKDPQDYLAWLAKVEKKKAPFWKELGMFDLIELSKVGPAYCPNMLLASLYFWDRPHQTFHFRCGMMTPTLFDLAAIVGLKPIGEEFDPLFLNEDSIGFDVSRAAYNTHIRHYHDTTTTEVFDIEHITFMALWLCRYVFFSRSIQVARMYITISNQLHVGRKLCLSEMILGHLYESLGESVTLLKTLGDRGNLLLSGPFWLLQLWLNSSFEKHLPSLQIPDEESEAIRNQTVEGIRLSQMTPVVEDKSLQQSYTSYVVAFSQRRHFTPSMASFSYRKVSPEWFTRKFPAPEDKDVEESNAIWITFLTPKVLALRLRSARNQVVLLGYQPNLVARQFGLVQILPKPLFSRKAKVLLYNMRGHEQDVTPLLASYKNKMVLVPTAFEPRFLSTPKSADWWKHYYSTEFLDVKGFKEHLAAAFSTLQTKKHKGRYFHIL